MDVNECGTFHIKQLIKRDFNVIYVFVSMWNKYLMYDYLIMRSILGMQITIFFYFFIFSFLNTGLFRY